MRIAIGHGFTLIEAMVTVSIISILFLWGVPGLFDFIRLNRLTTQTHSFITAINFARHEALNRNSRVVICAREKNHCRNDAQWKNGWIIFSDQDNDLQADNGKLIREFPSLTSSYTLSPNVNASSLTFYPNGKVRRASGSLPLMTFRLCAPDVVAGKVASRSREIVINASGRMRVQYGREGKTKC